MKMTSLEISQIKLILNLRNQIITIDFYTCVKKRLLFK